MALEDDATNAGNGVPPSPATAAPATPASQTAAPAAPVLPAHENRPTHSFAEAIRHALIGGTLGVVSKMAGPPPVDYSVDASGKTVATPRTDTTTSRLERIAQSALMGLSAGAAIPPQKSKGAAWGAGIGAGANAVRQQGEQQDLLKRQQAREDYDEAQRAMVHKATIAMTNATTHSTWQKFADDENAKDTERQKNAGIVSALNEYTAQNPESKLTVQTLTAEQAMAMHDADAHTAAKHTFLPIGIVQAKDANGNDVFEADGVTPKWVRQFAAIGGSADEKVPLPQGLVDDVKKYSKYDPRLKSFAEVQAGTMVPFTGFLTAYKYATEDKGREADGWKDPEGKNSVSVEGKIMQHNPFTTET